MYSLFLFYTRSASDLPAMEDAAREKSSENNCGTNTMDFSTAKAELHARTHAAIPRR
jgi:hypothetical protein